MKRKSILALTIGIVVSMLLTVYYHDITTLPKDHLPRLEVPTTKGPYYSLLNTNIDNQYDQELPTTITVYKTDPVSENELNTRLQEFSSLFGVNGGQSSTKFEYTIKNDASRCSVSRETGVCWFESRNYDDSDPNRIYNLPTEPAAIQFARAFFEDHGLMPDLRSFETLRYSCRYNELRTPTVWINTSVIVYLDQYIDDHYVNGYGIGASLTIGDNMTVIGCSVGWRAYSPYKPFQLHSKTEIVDLLRTKGVATQGSGVGHVTNAIITNISIHYFQELSDLSRTYYLQPLFVVEGKVSGEYGTDSFWEYVEALEY